jgi:hypothetical protein
MGGDQVLNKLIAGFTNDGTPLSATIGSKMEHGVVILTAAMLSNGKSCCINGCRRNG